MRRAALAAAAAAAVALAAGCASHSAPAAASDLATAADFANPERVTIVGWTDDAMEPFLSRDGRWLFFNNSNDPSVNTDLHYAERVDDVTFQYRGPIGGVNTTSALEGVASEDDAGELYFVSTRSYGTTMSTIYRGPFAAGAVASVELVAGVPASAAGRVIFDAAVSPDGATLAFAEGTFTAAGGPTDAELFLAARTATGFARVPAGDPTLQAVNLAGGVQYAPVLSASTLELFFTRIDNGTPAIYGTSRPSAGAPFAAPHQLAAITGFAEAPTLSLDEKSLYYHLRDGARFDLWRVTRP